MWFNSYFPFLQLEPRSRRKLAKYENNLEWQNTFINLVNIATYQFKWDNLPDTCNERYLELTLLTRGMACMVDDPERGYLTLAVNPYDSLNIYGEFSKIRAIGWNGYNREYEAYLDGADNTDTATGVLCRDNNMMYPYIMYIARATDRLTSAMRSMDVAAKKLKNPYFVVCDETQVESVKRILNDVDGNVESIVTSKATYSDMFKVFPTNVDVTILSALRDHYNFIDNEIRTKMGIDNNDRMSKKERLLTDEVNANNMQTGINLDMRLKQREKFCQMVNELFGLNVSVSIRKGEDVQDDNTKRSDIEDGDGLAVQ